MSITSSQSNGINQTSHDWNQFRDLMPVTKKWAYLDHAAVAPLPQPAADWVTKWMTESMNEGDAVWPTWARRLDEIRETAARLIGAAATEIAFVPNTTFGINLVADGFDWKPGDNVVIPDHEFPSNLYPWMALENRGVGVRIVELDGHKICPQRIADACDDRTRIVSASWVGYASGYRMDVAEIAQVVHDAGALFFLDAIQGMGVFPLDVVKSNVDFLAADGHKWMLGPEGAGIFYVAQEHMDKLRPMNVGWNSVKQGNDYSNVKLDIKDNALRYEGGSPNMVGNFGLGGSLDLLERFGLAADTSAIGDRVMENSAKLHEGLKQAGATVFSSADANYGSGIVSFEIPGKESGLMRLEMLKRNIVTSFRGGRIRAAIHCYNDQADIDQVVAAVNELK